MSKKTIMFVDDDDAFVLFIRQACSKIDGIESVMNAYDGLEALEMLNRRIQKNDTIPNVIFVDINMPRMDGFAFLAEFQKLRSAYPELAEVKPIAMLTSSDQQRDRERAKALGVDTYTVKSSSLKETRKIISDIIH